MRRKLFIGELCKELLYSICALQISSIIICIVKNFIGLIFVGCYSRRKFFTSEISASYGIQANTFISAISFIEETCQFKKTIVIAKFVNQYKHVIKETGIKVGCFVGFFHPVEKDLLIGKSYSNE